MILIDHRHHSREVAHFESSLNKCLAIILLGKRSVLATGKVPGCRELLHQMASKLCQHGKQVLNAGGGCSSPVKTQGC